MVTWYDWSTIADHINESSLIGQLDWSLGTTVESLDTHQGQYTQISLLSKS